MVKFTAYHEPDHSRDIKEKWRSILNNSGAGPSFKPRGEHQQPFYFFVDEAEVTKGNQRFLALCLVATQHAQHVVDAANEIHVRLVNDLWTDGDVSNLVKRGLHYAEATQDQRLKYIERLAVLPVDAYVAYCPYEAGNYEDTYLRLLSAMLPRRFIAADGKFAALTFEKNNKVSQPAIRDCVKNIHSQLETTNNRRPLAFNIEFVAKPNFGITAPDFFLGVLMQYLKSPRPPKDTTESRDRLLFDRLRDRYRVILDLSTGSEFTRRNPIAPWVE
jgi:hypothetical protein